MPQSAQVPGGIVSVLKGRADVIPSGEKQAKPLQQGDVIQPGDVILAEQSTELQISGDAGQNWAPRDIQVAMADTSGKADQGQRHGAGKATLAGKAAPTSLDEAINAVERGDEDAATAAGLSGGGGGTMTPGLRVDRVIETVTPQEFAYGTGDRTAAIEVRAADNSATPDVGNRAPYIDDNEGNNYAPSAGRYQYRIDEDQTVSGQVKAADPDGDALTYGKGSDPAHGTVTVKPDGSWTYTPNANYNGSDTFTVTVSDGKGGNATAVIDIGITPVNDAPRIDDADNRDPNTGHYKVTTDEDKPVSGRVQATDPDGDTLSYAKGSDPAHGTVTVKPDGSWTYTPGANFHGDDSFTVTVSDGKGGFTTATIDIGVKDINDTPKVTDPDSPNFDPVTGNYVFTTKEDVAVTGQVKATDPDEGDTLSFAKGSDPAHGTVTVKPDGSWTYTPNGNFNGDDSFTVTVTDSHGATTTSTIAITVEPVNDLPVLQPSDESPNLDPASGHYKLTTDEDQPVSGRVQATDPDGDTLSYAKGSDPAHGTVTVKPDGSWTYTPGANFHGDDSFTVTVSDGKGGFTTATIDIGVKDINDTPKVTDPDSPNFDPVTGNYVFTTKEDVAVTGQVKATDPDEGDTLSFAKGSDPAHGTVTVKPDGSWTYTPNGNFNGDDSFTVTVTDSHGATTTSTIAITVEPVNDLPVLQPSDESPNLDPASGHYKLTTDEDQPVSGRVQATDPDGDTLSYAKGSDPAHGTVTVKPDGSWTYTPGANFHGDDSFTVTVSDGKGGFTTATIDIGVKDINDTPKVTDPDSPNFDPVTGNYVFTTKEDVAVTGQVKATDPDEGDTLSFAKGSDPAHGTVTVKPDGSWTYTPNGNFNGDDSFTVTVTDSHGATTTSTIAITVEPVNDLPVLQPSTESPNFDPAAGHYKTTTDEDKPVSGRVQASDPDGDTLSYAKGSDPAHGTVTVKPDGSWTYTPGANFHGDDSFTVTVSDGKGGFTTATIDIGVKSVNDLPVLQPSTESPNLDPASGHYKLTTDEDKPVSGRVQATDPDGDPLSYAKGSDPAHGTVTVKPDGSWTYTPGANFHGDDSFTVTVSDGKGGFTTATIDIGVKSVNDAPVVTIPGSPSALSEEGLAGGNADTQGSSDTGNAKETAGRISFSDAEGDKVTLSLSGPSGLTSGGVAVTWSGSGSPTDPLIGKAGDKPILSATIDAQGNYKITLQGAIDHANTATEDVRDVSLTVKASDGTSTTTSTLTFQIEDDSPLSGAQVMRVDANTGSQNTNLMLIIDTSGSMQNTLADRTANGIKAAIKSLIDRYDDIGDVKIQIVTFSDGAQGRAAWMTVAQAKTFVDTLTANGGTNYDAALAAAKASFAVDGKLANAVNVSYFITDGQPNTGKGIDTGAEETNWEAFLKANHIDSYAVGTGTLTAQYIANIEPIAYNGITGTEQGATTLKTNAELTKYLIDTVPTIKAGSLAGLAGADGLARVESFSSGKQVSSVLDAGTKILTITLSSGAEIKLNTVTGDFTMKQGRDGGDETFSYTLVDKDGDRASGSVTLTTAAKAAANHAPEAYIGSDGHNILGLVDLSVNPLLNLAKDQHVAVNDVDNNLIRVDVSVGQVLSLGTLLGDHSKLTLALDPALTQGLHITGNDTRHLVIESDTAGHTIDVAQVNKLLATLAYDPAHVLGLSLDLFPQLTVKATDAAGATATKTVSSSLLAVDVDATDIANKVEHLVSGAGEHHGSCDTDVFAWSLADHHEGSEHHADTIHDFNCAARSAGGDVLDLRDLLQADHHAAAGTGDVDKLLHFLDFDTQSQPGSTIIHVSGSGGFQADASGHSESAGCADQQHIVLANVDIRSSLGLDQQANDHQIITELMNRGKLLVDNC